MTSSPSKKMKKSVKLSGQQIQFLKNEREKYESSFEASLHFGVNVYTIDRAITYGSCMEKTYNKLLRIMGFKELEEAKVGAKN